MSYNVRTFNLYYWERDEASRKQIINEIAKANPDVVMLQEYFTETGIKGGTIADLEKVGYKYHYVLKQLSNKNNLWGLAIFSKHPIVNKGEIELNASQINGCQFADISLHGETVRVYNIHLQSIHFSQKDYAYFENIKEGTAPDAAASKRIATLLKRAFVKRGGQAALVKEHMNQCPHPVIAGGDFNDNPNSYAYAQLSENMQDAYKVAGFGFGKTYAGKFPYRIDYLLLDEEFQLKKYKKIKAAHTDHYPVSVEFTFNE